MGKALLETAKATKAAQQSADIARDSLVQLERAFLSFIGIKYNIYNLPSGKQFIRIAPKIRNTGKTDEECNDFPNHGFFKEPPGRDSFEYPSEGLPGLIGPEQESLVQAFDMSRQQIEEMVPLGNRWYFWGKIEIFLHF